MMNIREQNRSGAPCALAAGADKIILFDMTFDLNPACGLRDFIIAK